MATNPKLEFYKFKLKHKRDKDKTFKNFAIDELRANKSIGDDEVIKIIHKHFVKSFKESFSKDDKLKKKVSLENKSSVNSHFDKRPNFRTEMQTIQGVINGGHYGRDGVIGDDKDEEENVKLSTSKSILLYYYILLYIPPNHNEGCFIIHSNSSEDTITNIFRHYIKNLFSGDNYNQAIPEAFCPKSFQDEFKKGAKLKSMSFMHNFVDTIHSTDAVVSRFNNYDIEIKVIPNEHITMSDAIQAKESFISKIFGSKGKEKELKDFIGNKVVAQNEITKSEKTFEWNTKDNEFVPTVYLKGKVDFIDGLPDFKDLDVYCSNLLRDEIIPIIRPDLDATKVK